jgi:Baseplate J-like protein
MIPIAALLAPPTSAQIRSQMVNALVALGIPANQWRQGGTASTLLTIVANTFGMFATLVSNALGAAFLTAGPGGPWLVLLAYYVYGVTAQQSTFANGTIALANTGGGSFSFAAGTASFLNSTTGITYVNTSPFTVAPLAPSTLVPVQATTAGSVGTSPAGAGAGTIDTIVSSMQGVTVSTPAPIVGLDADSNATIITKCLAAIANRSYKGPSGAYLAAVFNATNSVTGLPVNINRIQLVLDPSTGDITVYVASPGGVPIDTDVIGCQTSVTNTAQPMGITATVVACSLAAFASTITVWATGAGGGTADSTIQSEVEAALIAYTEAYPIGGLVKPPSTVGYLYASALEGVAKGADPLIYAVDGFNADLELAAGEIADVTSTIVIRRIP